LKKKTTWVEKSFITLVLMLPSTVEKLLPKGN